MIEKVNPGHPDKVADRIAGAIVDIAYIKEKEPKVAVEVLIGHGIATIIIETDVAFEKKEIEEIVKRIAGNNIKSNILIVRQDEKLNENQKEEIRCGDNGIFKGAPLRKEDKELSEIARKIYEEIPSDGKYILDGNKLIICQSNCKKEEVEKIIADIGNGKEYDLVINPLGEWTGGLNVDTGATNRKLGSDMATSLTGGGLHGKDLSKSDVAINIYAFLKAQKENKEINLSCAIGDNKIDGKEYSEIVEIARNYIIEIGGFEEFAKWGLY